MTYQEPIDPAAAGFRRDLAERIDRAALGEARGLHGVVASRGGRIFLERYYVAEDQRWGVPLGRVAFGPAVIHDMRSVSKSVVSLLYGILLEEWLVPPVGDSLLSHYTGYPDLAADPRRKALTIEHALTMTLGLEWNETLPYSDPRNGEIAMERAPDRYRYVLERPIVAAPGTRWCYSGGATTLIAHLVTRGSGLGLLETARSRLLGPLGITAADWVAGSNGEAAGASGLRLLPRDLLKIGEMILGEGSWQGRRIVPPDWLRQSLKPRAQTGDGLEYGYQWWMGRLQRARLPWYAAFGNGGQRLTVVPGLDLAVAVTAGRYNEMDAWKVPVSVMSEIIGALA